MKQPDKVLLYTWALVKNFYFKLLCMIALILASEFLQSGSFD
jgi:hypothetical protein